MNEAMKAAEGKTYTELLVEYGFGTTQFKDGSQLIIGQGEILIN